MKLTYSGISKTNKTFMDFPIIKRTDKFGDFYYVIGIPTLEDALTLAELYKEDKKWTTICKPMFNIFEDNCYSFHI